MISIEARVERLEEALLLLESDIGFDLNAPPQVRRLYSILRTRRGRCVSTPDLADLVWEGRPPRRDEDNGVKVVVWKLRKALRASGSGWEVVTKWGEGYQIRRME